jgi:hypothetical protein
MIVPTRLVPLGLFLLTLGAAPAMAQSLQSLGQAAGGMLSGQSGGSSMGGMSGVSGIGGSLGGLLGKAGPAISSAPTSNLSGLLTYCVQNNVLQGSNASSATSALGSLTGRQGVSTTQPGYAQGYGQGARGTLESGNGNALSLNSLPAPARSKVCDMVLSRAKSMM